MSNPFASGKHAIGLCDRCGQRARLLTLRKQVVKGLDTNTLVCWVCLDDDHPQLMLGTFPVNDPQALRDARPDTGAEESRTTQWGWAPVGGSGGPSSMSPNALLVNVAVGDVTVVVT
jgi:hypothetical protein